MSYQSLPTNDQHNRSKCLTPCEHEFSSLSHDIATGNRIRDPADDGFEPINSFNSYHDHPRFIKLYNKIGN